MPSLPSCISQNSDFPKAIAAVLSRMKSPIFSGSGTFTELSGGGFGGDTCADTVCPAKTAAKTSAAIAGLLLIFFDQLEPCRSGREKSPVTNDTTNCVVLSKNAIGLFRNRARKRHLLVRSRLVSSPTSNSSKLLGGSLSITLLMCCLCSRSELGLVAPLQKQQLCLLNSLNQ